MQFSHSSAVLVRAGSTFFISVCIILSASVASAQSTTPLTQDEQDVKAWYIALSDATATVPRTLYTLHPAGVAYIAAEQAYTQAQQDVIALVLTDIPARTVSTQAQARQVVQDITKRIASFNATKKRRDAASDALEARIAKSGLSQSLVATLNGSLSPQDQQAITLADGREHTALLDALNATKTFYATLATASGYATANNHFMFDSPLTRLAYWSYIASVRAALQNAFHTEVETLTYMLHQKDTLLRLRGADIVAGLEKRLADDTQTIAAWSAVAPQTPQQSAPAVTPAQAESFTLTVDDEPTRRLKADQQFSLISAQYSQALDEYNAHGWLTKESVVTKVTIRRAIALGETVVRLYKALEKRGFEIQKQYEAEYPVSLNVVAYAIHLSDEEFKNVLVSIQNQALSIDSPQFDVDVHKMLLTNAYTTHFGEPDAKYKVTFTKSSAQAAYVRKLDAYNAKYALALSAYEADQTTTQSTPAPTQ